MAEMHITSTIVWQRGRHHQWRAPNRRIPILTIAVGHCAGLREIQMSSASSTDRMFWLWILLRKSYYRNSYMHMHIRIHTYGWPYSEDEYSEYIYVCTTLYIFEYIVFKTEYILYYCIHGVWAYPPLVPRNNRKLIKLWACSASTNEKTALKPQATPGVVQKSEKQSNCDSYIVIQWNQCLQKFAPRGGKYNYWIPIRRPRFQKSVSAQGKRQISK